MANFAHRVRAWWFQGKTLGSVCGNCLSNSTAPPMLWRVSRLPLLLFLARLQRVPRSRSTSSQRKPNSSPILSLVTQAVASSARHQSAGATPS